MKVLVTGGAGYMGSELVFQLSQLDNITEVVVYDNLSNRNYNLFISHSNLMKNKKVKFVMGDLLDSRSLKKAMEGVEAVYHLAAKVNVSEEAKDSYAFEHTNHWGTAEVVYAAEEAGVKKFVYASSTGIYGFSKEGELLDEESRLNPRSFYAISKMRGEEHAARLSEKMNTVIFRIGNVYGYSPAIRFDSVINKFLFDSHFNSKISIHGSGKQTRPYVHLDKVVNNLLEVVTTSVESGTYNLVERNVKVLDLVDIYKEIYPELEFIFINQHLNLRDLSVKPSDKFKELSSDVEGLKEEIVKTAEESFAF